MLDRVLIVLLCFHGQQLYGSSEAVSVRLISTSTESLHLTYQFELRNNLLQRVNIADVAVSCPCVDARLETRSIDGRDATTLSAKVDTSEKRGAILEQIRLRTDAIPGAPIVIHLRGKAVSALSYAPLHLSWASSHAPGGPESKSVFITVTDGLMASSVTLQYDDRLFVATGDNQPFPKQELIVSIKPRNPELPASAIVEAQIKVVPSGMVYTVLVPVQTL